MSSSCGPQRPVGQRPARPAASSTSAATGRAHPEMVAVPAGEFLMGSDSAEVFPADGEGPVRSVDLGAYSISATCVTNAQYAEFVDATGYVTEAESFGWSFVFADLVANEAENSIIDGTVPGAPWWRGVQGATWWNPLGPGSGLDDIGDHPVVHVSWTDAVAFADWSGTRLPTEAEWERAARGGLTQAVYPWGDQLVEAGRHRANIWQGSFPDRNTGEDGYLGTAPADVFEPNGFGLFNMAGNVWEWTQDWFSPTWHVAPSEATRVDPQGPDTGTSKVVRGGSYLCHHSYCNRYRVAARTHNTPDTSLGHTGFRVAI